MTALADLLRRARFLLRALADRRRALAVDVALRRTLHATPTHASAIAARLRLGHRFVADRIGDAPEFVHPHFDLENRIVVANVGDIVFGSVYVPNGGKDFDAKMVFLNQMEQWSAALAAQRKHLVLCGDFNVARAAIDVHPVLRKNMVGQLKMERELIDGLFSHGLVDVGRHVDPDNDRLFTWWAPWRNMRQRNIGWRLDYVAAHHALVDGAVTCKSHREVGTSDHAPVIAHLRDEPLPPDAAPAS